MEEEEVRTRFEGEVVEVVEEVEEVLEEGTIDQERTDWTSASRIELD
jgi:hypothetical protein